MYAPLPCLRAFLNTLYIFLSMLNHTIIFLKTFYMAVKPGTWSTNNAHNPVEVTTTATAVNTFAHAAMTTGSRGCLEDSD